MTDYKRMSIANAKELGDGGLVELEGIVRGVTMVKNEGYNLCDVDKNKRVLVGASYTFFLEDKTGVLFTQAEFEYEAGYSFDQRLLTILKASSETNRPIIITGWANKLYDEKSCLPKSLKAHEINFEGFDYKMKIHSPDKEQAK